MAPGRGVSGAGKPAAFDASLAAPRPEGCSRKLDGPRLPESHLIRNEEEREITEALSRLRPADREILQARLWDELSPTETAAILGISRAAVDQRFSRAKRRMARELSATDRSMGRATPITEEGGAT